MTYLRHAFYLDTVELRLLPEGAPIRQQAREILAGSVLFQETISSVSNKWQALGSVYEAPEQDLVLQAMNEPVLQAADHLEGVRVFHAGLDAFGFELDEVHRAVSELHRDADAASLVWFDTLDELNASGASDHEKETARADAIAPFEARLRDINARYERARADCLRSLSRITRSSRDVISSFPSGLIDLASAAREDAIAALDKAGAPDASQEDITAFYNLLLVAGPDLMKEIGRHPGAAHFVNGMGAHEEVAFWNKLNFMQQEALALALPGLVGNLEGAPYATRDKANRKLLGILREEFNSAELGSSTGYDFSTRMQALDRLEEALKQEGRYLIMLDPRSSAPRAAIVVGDLDAAKNVTYLVPGMNSSSADAVTMAGHADDLRRRQKEVGVYGADTAVMIYMGYDSPNYATVVSENSAEMGSPALATSLDGLYLTRESAGSVPEVHVIAHSYGTTITSIALSQLDYPVTSAVFLASAGLPADMDIADLMVDVDNGQQSNVFVSTAESDWLAPFGSEIGGRNNPVPERGSALHEYLVGTNGPWGAHQFSSDDVTVDGVDYTAVDGHPMAGYLGEGTFSAKISAMITSGRIQEAVELMNAGIR